MCVCEKSSRRARVRRGARSHVTVAVLGERVHVPLLVGRGVNLEALSARAEREHFAVRRGRVRLVLAAPLREREHRVAPHDAVAPARARELAPGRVVPLERFVARRLKHVRAPRARFELRERTNSRSENEGVCERHGAARDLVHALWERA